MKKFTLFAVVGAMIFMLSANASAGKVTLKNKTNTIMCITTKSQFMGMKFNSCSIMNVWPHTEASCNNFFSTYQIKSSSCQVGLKTYTETYGDFDFDNHVITCKYSEEGSTESEFYECMRSN
jgi:hypothetical protein